MNFGTKLSFKAFLLLCTIALSFLPAVNAQEKPGRLPRNKTGNAPGSTAIENNKTGSTRHNLNEVIERRKKRITQQQRNEAAKRFAEKRAAVKNRKGNPNPAGGNTGK